ncbi:hypothetical protein [Trinickia soli]|uniref:Uncharacterized protein n=1 Tax=Trinickia soli TaxID=380675 RepID=A0A2N7VKT6_9BURK|nr:hypothetical protein [Trinickia soli]KAA0078758.1 hypothetical protein CIW54_25405 [Paraburkholderia sp. T12-10]PMS17759.1 hypothetical protein C0Z19_23935 [Trinickia soli]
MNVFIGTAAVTLDANVTGVVVHGRERNRSRRRADGRLRAREHTQRRPGDPVAIRNSMREETGKVLRCAPSA